ncbi:MAG: outer membrane lipoprotein-sorting protein [Salinivirgaceae bacterium]|nr:outer membrane lipoprotein-sorting protein [Salinivirgaceae bacterium]
MFTTGILAVSFLFTVFAQDAKEIIKKADDKFQGNSNKSEMSMSIIRPAYTRTIEFKNWSLDRDYFMTIVTAPAKDKGQVFMKHQNDMWNYMPAINRMIKLPPSMMSQGWMGSDYSNDDLVKQSSIVVDYDHTIAKSETINDHDCFKIVMIPHEDANVVWGKVIVWVDKALFIMHKSEYYDEEEYLVRTEIGKDIKVFDGRELPSIIEIIPADEEGHKTIIQIKSMDFDMDIKQSFFTQQNMKRVR